MAADQTAAAGNGNGTTISEAARLKKEAEKERKKKREKAKKERRAAAAQNEKKEEAPSEQQKPGDGDAVDIEYVAAPHMDGEDEENPFFQEFQEIFTKFDLAGRPPGDEDAEEAAAVVKAEEGAEKAEADAEKEEEEDADTLSKKKKKMLRRMKVAELKQVCRRPEVVEMWDVTAQDPRLLVYLKAYRNTVPVPRHWSQKRKFLQGKRGIEKPPFELPDFIAATGIGKVREAYAEKEDSKSLKQKGKERMMPKMNKIDIDYSILHDAFFKHQRKPKMTAMGDTYYEGKEFEIALKNKKPGVVSDELKAALGMTDGAPPPWLINMQRYGPPPSYTHLRIPGLNAPIPAGATFGYHPGGWGKPPVDEMGNPLYGDVFGTNADRDGPLLATPFDVPVDRERKWGDLEEEEEEDESEEEEEDGDEDADAGTELGEEEEAAGTASVATGISSLPSGIDTPSTVELRKRTETERAKQLYQVLEQREAHVDAKSIMGASHTYVVPGMGKQPPKPGGAKGQGDVAITLRPEDFEAGLDDAALAQKFKEAEQAEKEANTREDFSDMVAEHAQKQKRKLEQKKKEAEKAKKFKF